MKGYGKRSRILLLYEKANCPSRCGWREVKGTQLHVFVFLGRNKKVTKKFPISRQDDGRTE